MLRRLLPYVKTTQHFSDVELDVQKSDVFAKYDAQKVVALSQIVTYVMRAHIKYSAQLMGCCYIAI